MLRKVHAAAFWLSLALTPVNADWKAQSWGTSYGASLRAAAATKKNLLLDFGRTGCAPCEKLEAGPLKDPAVVAELKGLIRARIDGDRYPELVRELAITGYPTLILAAPDGTILRTATGYLEAGPLLEFLRGPPP